MMPSPFLVDARPPRRRTRRRGAAGGSSPQGSNDARRTYTSRKISVRQPAGDAALPEFPLRIDGPVETCPDRAAGWDRLRRGEDRSSRPLGPEPGNDGLQLADLAVRRKLFGRCAQPVRESAGEGQLIEGIEPSWSPGN